MALWIGIFLDQGFQLSEAIQRCVNILEGAYSFVLISILEPNSMYIVKNTGTMVIGVPPEFAKTSDDSPVQTLQDGHASKFVAKADGDKHLFQIVASDTTVF